MLPETIITLRQAYGMTQLELAKATGISLSLIRKIEKGKRSITPEKQQLIKNYFFKTKKGKLKC